MRIIRLLPTALASLTAATAIAATDGGEVHLTFRLRDEYVSDAALSRPADAGTVRTRLSLATPRWSGWRILGEVDDVRAWQQSYNSTRNGVTDRPIVADPAGTDLNVAAIEWQNAGRRIVLGRQRANLDNQRFIGASGWRQNEQTFDGLSAGLPLGARVDLTYAAFYNVNRVYGPSNGSQKAEWHGLVQSLLLNLRLGSVGTLTPYFYSMDFHNAAAQSNRTGGVTYKRTWTLGTGWTLPVRAGWAAQSASGANPTDYRATYSDIEAALVHGHEQWKIGRETLGGDPLLANHRFQTPLATLHIFEGWVDKFLTTPPQGVEDTYLNWTSQWPRVTTQLSWHDLRAAAIARRYGTELDGSVTLRLTPHHELLLKGGRYHSQGYGSSATKLWLQWQASY